MNIEDVARMYPEALVCLDHQCPLLAESPTTSFRLMFKKNMTWGENRCGPLVAEMPVDRELLGAFGAHSKDGGGNIRGYLFGYTLVPSGRIRAYWDPRVGAWLRVKCSI